MSASPGTGGSTTRPELRRRPFTEALCVLEAGGGLPVTQQAIFVLRRGLQLEERAQVGEVPVELFAVHPESRKLPEGLLVALAGGPAPGVEDGEGVGRTDGRMDGMGDRGVPVPGDEPYLGPPVLDPLRLLPQALRVGKLVGIGQRQQGVVGAFEADRRERVAGEPAPADRKNSSDFGRTLR